MNRVRVRLRLRQRDSGPPSMSRDSADATLDEVRHRGQNQTLGHLPKSVSVTAVPGAHGAGHRSRSLHRRGRGQAARPARRQRPLRQDPGLEPEVSRLGRIVWQYRAQLSPGERTGSPRRTPRTPSGSRVRPPRPASIPSPSPSRTTSTSPWLTPERAASPRRPDTRPSCGVAGNLGPGRAARLRRQQPTSRRDSPRTHKPRLPRAPHPVCPALRA